MEFGGSLKHYSSECPNLAAEDFGTTVHAAEVTNVVSVGWLVGWLVGCWLVGWLVSLLYMLFSRCTQKTTISRRAWGSRPGLSLMALVMKPDVLVRFQVSTIRLPKNYCWSRMCYNKSTPQYFH